MQKLHSLVCHSQQQGWRLQVVAVVPTLQTSPWRCLRLFPLCFGSVALPTETPSCNFYYYSGLGLFSTLFHVFIFKLRELDAEGKQFMWIWRMFSTHLGPTIAGVPCTLLRCKCGIPCSWIKIWDKAWVMNNVHRARKRLCTVQRST